MVTFEQFQKQKIILAISISVFLIFLIFSSPLIKPTFKFGLVASLGLALICFWILGYGIRFIYSAIRLKSFSVSFFVLLLFWMLAIIPLIYAVFN